MTSRTRTARLLTAVLGCTAILLTGCSTAGGDDQPAAPLTSTAPTPTQTLAAPTTAAPIVKPVPPKPVNHCASNTAAQLVLVSVKTQHLWLCAGTRTAYESPVTTGMVGEYTSTPTGHYAIQMPSRDTTLTLNTGAQYDVKYWVPFDAPLFGFHDSSWQDFPYGSAKYRTEGSHGCIHLPLAGMKFLFDWAHVGAAVDIRA